MSRIGYAKDVMGLKDHLEQLKNRMILTGWEMPHENIISRLTAAVVFISADKSKIKEVIEELTSKFFNYKIHYRPNDEKKMSRLGWTIEFDV